MKNLPVLLVSPVGEIGGGEKVFLSLIERLPEFQVEPILACMRPGSLVEAARQSGIKAYAFKAHRYRELSLVWQGIQWLAQIIQETEAQLVHANHASHIYSSLATRFTSVPEIWHLHDYPYHWDWVDQVSIRLPTDYVIFTTHKVWSGYPHLLKRPHSIIPPICIDPAYLRGLTPQDNIRIKYNLAHNSLFLTVTRIQEHKGHRYLLDAIHKVVQSDPNVTFAIVGKPSDSEQERYMQTLLSQANSLGIEQQVKFLGYVSEPDLVSLHHEATALIHPAITEGFGLVLLEAMSLETPVIAAAADGPCELIVDGETGLIVPTADSDSLAEAIISLLKSPDLAKNLSDRGRATAEQFSVDKMVKATVDVYRSLVS
ncbi:glycosyltransferase family 4 protein [Leptolyngbya sp. GB1-A1]|uniref:glycosyltransferase family 4 protein n=2 Tax=Leptolyngbya TaxID=47251 RepID=UPI002FAD0F95